MAQEEDLQKKGEFSELGCIRRHCTFRAKSIVLYWDAGKEKGNLS